MNLIHYKAIKLFWNSKRAQCFGGEEEVKRAETKNFS